MEAHIIFNDDKNTKIKWSCPEKGFGELTFKYQDNGKYEVDAEFRGFDTIVEILQALPKKG